MGIVINCLRVSEEQLNRLRNSSDEKIGLLMGRIRAKQDESYWSSPYQLSGLVETLINGELSEKSSPSLDLSKVGMPINDTFWAGFSPLRYLTASELLHLVEHLKEQGWRSTLDGTPLYAHPANIEWERTEQDDWSGEENPFSSDQIANPLEEYGVEWVEYEAAMILALDLLTLFRQAARSGEAVLIWWD